MNIKSDPRFAEAANVAPEPTAEEIERALMRPLSPERAEAILDRVFGSPPAQTNDAAVLPIAAPHPARSRQWTVVVVVTLAAAAAAALVMRVDPPARQTQVAFMLPQPDLGGAEQPATARQTQVAFMLPQPDLGGAEQPATTSPPAQLEPEPVPDPKPVPDPLTLSDFLRTKRNLLNRRCGLVKVFPKEEFAVGFELAPGGGPPVEVRVAGPQRTSPLGMCLADALRTLDYPPTSRTTFESVLVAF